LRQPRRGPRADAPLSSRSPFLPVVHRDGSLRAPREPGSAARARAGAATDLHLLGALSVRARRSALSHGSMAATDRFLPSHVVSSSTKGRERRTADWTDGTE